MTLEELLAAAEARVARLRPAEALAAQREGAVLVDIRSDTARSRDGVVPGSVHIPRTVLEWRLAADSEWRNPHVPDDARIILLCDHGYSSVLAAATLVELGIDAGDVVGGFAAWCAAALPTAPAPPVPATALPGMEPPVRN